MRKVRILGIAPYEGLAVQLRNEARKREDIDIDVYIGDLEDGVATARRRFPEGYDIIVSRGGTSDLIKQNGFPVIDITISLYDILRSLRLADDARKKYAIVGFPSVTRNAVFLKEVLTNGMDIEIITIKSLDDSDNAMQRLKQEGVINIVCDMTGSRSAMKNKLNFILINSGTESISSALDLAVRTARQQIGFSEMLSVSPFPVIIMRGGNIISGSKTAEDIPEGFLRSLQSNSGKLEMDERCSLDYEDCGALYSAVGCRFSWGEGGAAGYYIRKTEFPFSLEENGITVRNARRASSEFEKSFFAVTNTAAKEIEILDSFTERDHPVFLAGEPGTGKGPLSQYLYISSRHASAPMYDIDCSLVGRKAPDFIRGLYLQSPELKAVFNFKNLDKLDEAAVDGLLELNEEYRLCLRAYIIASATVERGKPVTGPCVRLLNRMQFLTLHLESLRDHADDIASIASVYINFLNRTQGSTVLTIEDEAIEVMKDYDWPYNNDQLARILKKLSISPSRDVITASDIRKAIDEDERMFRLHGGDEPFCYEGMTLREIEHDIIQRVLRAENDNRSIAARKLGISRSTLWRMLQESE